MSALEILKESYPILGMSLFLIKLFILKEFKQNLEIEEIANAYETLFKQKPTV